MPRGEWKAPVVGVFRKGVALVHPDGLWVTILRSRRDMEARGLWAGADSFEALASAVREGSKIAFREGCGLTLAADACRLDLPLPEVWDPRPALVLAARGFAGLGPPGWSRAAARLETALKAEGFSEGIHGDGPFGARFSELRGESDFPCNLVGFGPGTTPAGDDFLSGFLLGACLCGGGLDNPVSGEVRSRISEGALARTTVPGRTLLEGAVRGIFPAYLVRTAESLAEPPDPEFPPRTGRLERALTAAFRHGASSGRDALRGLMEALERDTGEKETGCGGAFRRPTPES